MSSLGTTSFVTLTECSSDDDDDDGPIHALAAQMNAFTLWSFAGSECPEAPELHPRSMIAVDLQEMFAILESEAYASWGVEIVEICGGIGLTSHLCVKRRLQSGHNFELITGTDLTVPDVQQKVMDYIDLAKPLVVVMAPVCGPFGLLGSRNQVLHDEAWLASMQVAVPLAKFCGRVALKQMRDARHLLVEQPHPSKLYEVPPCLLGQPCARTLLA